MGDHQPDQGPGQRGRAKEALLEAAVRCIQGQGYAHTTQRDVLAASGANPRSISYHYGSLEQLLAAGLAEAFRRRSEPVLDAAAQGVGSPLERLARSFLVLLDQLKSDRELAFALADGISQARREELRTVFAEHYANLRTQIAAVARAALGERLEAAGGDLDALAAGLLALFDGLVLQWLVEPDKAPEGVAVLRSVTAAFALAAGEDRDLQLARPGKEASSG